MNLQPAARMRVVLAAALAAIPFQNLYAQSQFTVHVTERLTQRPVESRIEYEQSPGQWRTLRGTDANGMLSGNCPGSVSIRANAWPVFRLSPAELCGGQHDLRVARRSAVEIAAALTAGDRITIGTWANANIRAALLEARLDPETRTSAEFVRLEYYANDPRRLTREERQAIGTRNLNGTISEFLRIDTDGDRTISAGELREAIVPQ